MGFCWWTQSATMMNSPNDNAVIAANNVPFYDKFWTQYGVEATGEEKRRAEAICRAIQKLVQQVRPKLLDLGCGRGWLAPYLYKCGEVTGVDFSSSGIEFAKNHYGSFGRFYVARADSARLGLPDGEMFDLVVCS